MKALGMGTNSPPPNTHTITTTSYFLVFAFGCLSQLLASPLPLNVTPDHSFKNTLKKNCVSLPHHPPPPTHQSICPDMHVCRGSAGFQACSLQPQLLDHYYAIISSDGGSHRRRLMYPFPPLFRAWRPGELPECSLIGIECPFKLPSTHQGGGEREEEMGVVENTWRSK